MTLPRSSPGLGLALLLCLATGLYACAEGGYDNDGSGGSAAGSPAPTGGGGGAGGGGGGENGSEIVPGSRAGGDGGEGGMGDAAPTFDLDACESDAPKIPFYLSSDDSNSMASPVLARELLNAGLAPPKQQIRTYEFLNYYNVLYDLPDEGKLGLFTEMAPEGFTSDNLPAYRLQIGVQAPEVPRPDFVITFVVDASGSLVGEGIERERAALLAIGHQLRQGDIVNIVTWSTDENVLLEKFVATGTPADAGLLAAAVNQLVPGGGSDLHSGLVKGYELALAQFDPTRLNRVVLVSDGGANLGVVDEGLIRGVAADAQKKGLYLVGIGVGPANGYSDALMDLVTDAGRGAYVYLDGAAEADAVFTDRFDEIMNVAASNVRVELDLPAYMEIQHFYGESYSEDKEAIDPQNLAPGDSMVLSQVVYVKAPSAACGLDKVGVRVTWETPLTGEIHVVEAPPATLLDLVSATPSPRMWKANAVIAYAEALKAGGAPEILAAIDKVNAAIAKTGDPDGDLGHIVDLLVKHPVLEK